MLERKEIDMNINRGHYKTEMMSEDMELRSFEEIKEKINSMDVFTRSMVGIDLVKYLPYEYAKEYLKPDCTEKEWTDDLAEYTKDNIIEEMKDYISFAWDKANNCRGVSACRSLMHFSNWFWLIGEDELSDYAAGDYEYYGKPQLEKITEWLGLNPKDYDDGERTNTG
jgi:hypothetical protein